VTERIFNVLFLCRGNSARSIFAEAILNRIGAGRFRAYSAGSHPEVRVHPMAVEVLRERGYDPSGFRPKSPDEFAQPGAPAIDFVLTLCDMAVGESCPAWPSGTLTAHCGVEDPAAFTGPADEQHRLFRRVFDELERRIEQFANLPVESLDHLSLQAHVAEIANSESRVGEPS